MELFRWLFASKHRPYVPRRDRLETLTANLSGTRFSISLPPNSIADIDPRDPPPEINIYDPDSYTSVSGSKWYQIGTHAVTPVLKRSFAFHGAFWENVNIGDVMLGVAVFRVDDFSENMTCLNPRHFEQAITRSNYFRYGPPRRVLEGQGYIVPVNWRLMTVNGHEWVYFEAHRDMRIYPPEPNECIQYECFLFTPLEDKHYLKISFRCGAYSPVNLGMASVSKLVNQIISTVHIELAPAVQQRQAEIRQRYPHDRLSTAREPETWVYHQWRDGDEALGEDYDIVTKQGTPPPEFTP